MVSLQLGDHNVPAATIGLLLAIAGLAPLFLGIPVGGLTDRFGSKTVFLLGAVCIVLGYVGLALTVTPSLVSLMFALAMSGTTACIISGQALLISAGPVEQMEHSLGWFGTVSAAAQLLGPALGGVIGDRYGIDVVFWVCALGGALALLFTPLLPASGSRRRVANEAHSLTAGLGLLRIGQMRFVMAVAFLLLLAFDVRNSFFPLFLDSLGLTRTHIGLVFTAQALVAISIRTILGKLSRRWGAWPLLTMAIAVAIPAFFVLPWMSTVTSITIVALALGLTTGISQPITAALAVAQVSASSRGLALGLRMSSQRLATVLSPFIMGFVAAAGSLSLSFMAAGVISAGAAGASLLGWRAWRQPAVQSASGNKLYPGGHA